MKKIIKIISASALAIVIILYIYPIPTKTLQDIHRTDIREIAPLENFRNYPTSTMLHNGNVWEYIVTERRSETILFLHGMGGSYDIWWQQIESLKDSFQVISVTYPPIPTLEGMAKGVLAILDKEGIEKVHVVGTSLGGAFSQYLAAYYSNRLMSATFGNTFVPNTAFHDLAAPQFKTLPYIPQALLMSIFRKGAESQHYPASDSSEILRTYLLEQGYGKMSKAQFVSRAKCVLDIFDQRAPADLPIFIIESNNDQLIPAAARQALKEEYPNAAVYTFQGKAGHFPYVNRPEEYTQIINGLLSNSLLSK